mgnify:CR=1 FL=1
MIVEVYSPKRKHKGGKGKTTKQILLEFIKRQEKFNSWVKEEFTKLRKDNNLR